MSEILQYIHKDGFFHRLHPFTKIFFIFVASVICVLATGIPFLIVMVAALLAVAYISHLHREVIQQLRLVLLMSVVFVIITVLTMPNGTTLGYLIPRGIPLIGSVIPVTDGAIGIGLVLALRFMVLIFAFQLFLISTQPRDLVHAMEKLHMPVDYILMFIIALRFIPTLQIEGRRIHEAQLARGYNPGTGMLGKIRSVAPIVVPLVSNALLRSTVLGLTIDMRGYRTGTRTHVHERTFCGRDYAMISGLIVAAVGFGVIATFAPGLVF
ncbi:energy-coupling factor transporter transmembrane component T family protein [Methanoregula sp.]|uniref:energy-coupling factor transporter transmembrane component T family protein n=1 Tax=Methanoregula sp. TaxID=2052170 RepID=UPI003BAE2A13